jgi:thioredoxin reductase
MQGSGTADNTTPVDVLIVGAGPAGLAAALELRALGVARVLVVEREEQAGGIPRHSAHTGFGLRDFHRLFSGPHYAARYVRLAREAGVELRTGSTVTAWLGPTALAVTSASGLDAIQARAVLLATGCRERPRAARLVPGTRPHGVLTTGALQQLAAVQPRAVGRRAVVVGAEHVSISAVLTLAHCGASTVAMITEHPCHQTYAPLAWLVAVRQRAPIVTSSRVSEIFGGQRVEAVEVTDLCSGAVTRHACDTVVFTGDWIADHEIARRGGLEMDPATRAPRIDLALRTTARGVFAAGNLLHGAETADVAALSGRHAARAIRRFLDDGSWPATPLALHCTPPLRWVSPSALDGGTAPPHGHFILRVGEVRTRAELVVAQGTRELWRQHHRRLIPNRTIRVAGEWLARVDLDGPPPVFRLA